MARLFWRYERSDRIQSHYLQRFAVQLGLATCGGKPALGKRQKFLTAKVEPDMTFPLQAGAVNSSQPAVGIEIAISRAKRAINHLVGRLPEAGIFKAHADGKLAEQI